MPRNFDLSPILAKLGIRRNDPRAVARVVLGTLVACNLIAAWFVYQPWGGSAEEMEARLTQLRHQVAQKQSVLQRTKALAAKIDKGRAQGDEFLSKYFLSRPTTYSSVVAELNEMAKKSGVRVKEQAFNEDEVEGSDELSMLSITAGYEGNYADLLHFVRELDQANRLVILESLAASPQQGSGVLNVTVRLNAFIRESPLIAEARLAGEGGAQ